MTHTEISPEQVTGTVWFVQLANKKTRSGLGEPTPKSVGSRAQSREFIERAGYLCFLLEGYVFRAGGGAQAQAMAKEVLFLAR